METSGNSKIGSWTLTLLHLSSKHFPKSITAFRGPHGIRLFERAAWSIWCKFMLSSLVGDSVINSERLSMAHHIKDSHVAWLAPDGCRHCITYSLDLFGLFALQDCVRLWSSVEMLQACSGTIHHNTMHPPKPAQKGDMSGIHSFRRYCWRALFSDIAWTYLDILWIIAARHQMHPNAPSVSGSGALRAQHLDNIGWWEMVSCVVWRIMKNLTTTCFDNIWLNGQYLETLYLQCACITSVDSPTMSHGAICSIPNIK